MDRFSTIISDEQLRFEGAQSFSPLLSDAGFRALLDANLLGIGCSDKNGVFSYANDRLLNLVGYTREDLLDGLVRWDWMTPPEFALLDRQGMTEAIERGACTPYEKECIRKDGGRVPIRIGYAMTSEPEPQFVGFVMDMTAHKAIEAELREREEKFRTLAESLPQMIFTCDSRGNKTYCCHRYMDYTGATFAELTGNWIDLIHPDDRTATASLWRESLTTGKAYKTEYRMRRHDGVFRYHLAHAVPVHNDTGEIVEWIGSITDIHDRKQTEDLLRRTEKLSAAARIAASIAHEINNPLASVTNSLYLAMQDPNLSDVTRQYLKLADMELARVAQVTTQSLRFHKQSMSAAAVDVGSNIMDTTLSTFSRKFEGKRIRVLRKYRTSHNLFCRGEELRQAVGHLLSNAVDAMPNGGLLYARVREGLDPTRKHPGIQITVADTGIGIPADFLPRIFEAFTSTKEPTGTGLGMWVVDGIVRSHNGTIAVRSRATGQSRGTVVRIFLPFLGATDDPFLEPSLT